MIAASPWTVPVTRLRRAPGARQAECRTGRLAGGPLTVVDSEVPAGATVVVDVVLDAVIGGVEVSGHVRAPWAGLCRRCLRPVTGELDTAVRELYRPASPAPKFGAASAPDASEDEETYPLGGDLLDLAPLARDALLLALPLAPLCRPDCAGLCPTCGADLNEGLCACPPAAADPRWSVLDALREDGEAR
ncbi:MAG: DUF177 domain-containing protein [Acidimicrobiaceae bacterium]|nr:DUF177 domain-containing protein [Acidimicrobiaceae bacterium]